MLHVLIWFSVDFSFIGPLQVIWAIGWSMIVLAALVHSAASRDCGLRHRDDRAAQPARRRAGHGVEWSGHPRPERRRQDVDGAASGRLTPVLGPASPLVWVQYPLIPWVGVMAAGYAFGAVYELERQRRIRLLRYLGLSLVVAFVAIRFIDIYGDPLRGRRSRAVSSRCCRSSTPRSIRRRSCIS